MIIWLLNYKLYIIIYWLVLWNMNFGFVSIDWKESSQLTSIFFQSGRSTTNQNMWRSNYGYKLEVIMMANSDIMKINGY
jgi:hypothetical protein